jgi:hypothetical protein
MNQDLEDILKASDKKVKFAVGPLAKLYRQILADINMNSTKMNDLIRKWLDDPRNNIPKDKKMQSSERGNRVKEMAREDMTWRVFLRNLRILSPVKVELQVRMHWQWGRITAHTIDIHMSDMIDNEQMIASEEPLPGDEIDGQQR